MYWMKHFQVWTLWMMWKKSPIVLDFSQKHCKSRIFFQVKTYNNLSCLDTTIDAFAERVSTEVDGVLYYQPGSNLVDKFLLSILEDVQKPSHNKCFSPTAETAKNIGFVITYVKCKTKSRKKIWREWNGFCQNWQTCMDLL